MKIFLFSPIFPLSELRWLEMWEKLFFRPSFLFVRCVRSARFHLANFSASSCLHMGHARTDARTRAHALAGVAPAPSRRVRTPISRLGSGKTGEVHRHLGARQQQRSHRRRRRRRLRRTRPYFRTPISGYKSLPGPSLSLSVVVHHRDHNSKAYLFTALTMQVSLELSTP